MFDYSPSIQFMREQKSKETTNGGVSIPITTILLVSIIPYFRFMHGYTHYTNLLHIHGDFISNIQDILQMPQIYISQKLRGALANSYISFVIICTSSTSVGPNNRTKRSLKITQRCEYALPPYKVLRRPTVDIFIPSGEKTAFECVSFWLDGF